ncbi:hypothetical protein BKA70DRAFT_1147351 [Coprinopsis sp. MPI-PUGE-AT-0042]|nr:hypothetical protein BKA70DRAFT_1147351 [Coprinopsis sp. MPI-PUGE-AT-0042]
MLPPQSHVAWKVCITALHAVAISVAVLRIRIRWRGAKLWWDDYIAAAAMLINVAFAIAFWFAVKTLHAGPPMTPSFTKLGRMSVMMYLSIFWMSRVSLALSISRVFPAGTVARKSLLAMAALFFILFAFSCALIGSFCIWSPSIYPPDMDILAEYQNCQPGTLRYFLVGGATATVDFLSDIVAIIVPLRFLWRITLPPSERRLVHGAISATILTALSSVVTCVFWYARIDLGQDFRIIVAGVIHQQAAMSLIICNLLVVVTYWWRKVYRRNRPTPRRYRHNDPNIPTSETSSRSPSSVTGSRSDGAGYASSSRLPDDLTFTPITPLGAESASNPSIWTEPSGAKACTPAGILQTGAVDSRRAPVKYPPSPSPSTRNHA